MNAPISLAGMIVVPGDLILGDEDGVVCVPKDRAQDVHDAAVKKAAAEEKQMAETVAGTLDRSWIDRALRDKGCTVEIAS